MPVIVPCLYKTVSWIGHGFIHWSCSFELDTCRQFDTATFKIVIKILTFGTELF